MSHRSILPAFALVAIGSARAQETLPPLTTWIPAAALVSIEVRRP